ncbi:uncharacterized protein SPSK_02688 [Sporothrix schenckii 1099-18]|uniref:Mitochondrial import inner membrane translocase subunit TIM22 n=2 Tax=Sporothrix schenckii TaxID=29908 RepID=U7PJA8_SPOS1|nr:uncharacterized protein SPSK_02688 [Sporothrix schenckii 1099-18]ERS95622.1 hypothetical protein HMPREF1624_08138 [Sporothrix schenckii ATCC 58251]KJR86640.1 hypothetical protein SPSK_02688 [Sporothrix schenckii 1099-18]
MNFPGSGLGGGAGAGSPGIDPNDPNMKRMQAVMDSCFAKTALSGVAGFALGGIFGLFMASMAYDTPYHTPVPTNTPAANAAAAGGKAAASLATTSTTGAAGTAAKTVIGAGAAAPTTVTTAATNAATTSTVASTSAAAATSTSSSTSSLKPATLATSAPKPAVSIPVSGAAAAYVEPPSIPLRQQLATGFRDMGSRSYSSARNFGTVGALFAGIECGIEGLRAKNDMGNGVAAGCLTGAILARNAGPQAAAIGCAGFAAFSAAIDAYLRMPPSDD